MKHHLRCGRFKLGLWGVGITCRTHLRDSFLERGHPPISQYQSRRFSHTHPRRLMRGLALQRLPQTQCLRISHATIGSHRLLSMIMVPGALNEEDSEVGHCHLKLGKCSSQGRLAVHGPTSRMPPCIQAVNHLLLPVCTPRYTAFHPSHPPPKAGPMRHKSQRYIMYNACALRSRLSTLSPQFL
jgi:hypothetical protein